MNRAHADRPIYSGAPWWPHAVPVHPHHGHPGHGFCHSCCHPRAKCCCGCRECRKEAKELLVLPDIARDQVGGKASADVQFRQRISTVSPFFTARMQNLAAEDTGKVGQPRDDEAGGPEFLRLSASAAAAPVKLGYGTAFIGGGCCVHLSIEYSPSSPTATSAVGVLVQGSDDTLLAWFKIEQPGAGYQVKEGIIATQPGADLAVIVVNMTARVRWCEIFSC